MNILDELLAGAIADARTREDTVPLSRIIQLAAEAEPARDAYAALQDTGKKVRIIAEIKRSSPSRGGLAAIPDPVKLALQYQAGGASAISVLTEGRKFAGSLQDLVAVKAQVSLPVLRKDFIGTEYQVYEARAFGADIVLLIVACLDDDTLHRLYKLAHKLGMAVLVEVHDQAELERAKTLGAKMIGINARNLKTFELNRGIFAELSAGLPEDVIKVAESAVSVASDVTEYLSAGADAILIGEALVTQDPLETLAQFLKA